MLQQKAGAASPTRVRRPAAPKPAGKRSEGVAHSTRVPRVKSSVSGTRSLARASALVIAFVAVSGAALVVAGMVASHWPLASAVVGLIAFFAAAAYIGGKQ